MFRNEITSYKPFPVEEWVNQTYVNQDQQWNELYVHAREKYKKQLEKEKQQKEISLLTEEIANRSRKNHQQGTIIDLSPVKKICLQTT